MPAEGHRPRRSFLRLGATEWHVRRVGSGQPVILLADPPQASRSLLALGRAIAPHAEAIAIDLPGLGDSRATDLSDPQTDPLAHGVIGLIEALDVAPATLFAAGAAVPLARRIAALYPDHVTALALLDPPPDDPDWDAGRIEAAGIPVDDHGGYLARIWTGLRDRARYRADALGRLGADRSLAAMPTPGVLTIAALDHLQALPVAADVVRACLAPGDADVGHPHRLLSSEPNAETPLIPVASPQEIAEAILALVTEGRHGPPAERQALTLSDPDDGRFPARRFVATGQGAVHVIQAGTGDGPAIVWLADAFSSALAARPMLAALPPGQTAIALDLPGVGDTPGFAGDPPGLITWANTALEAIDAAGLSQRPMVVAGRLWSSAVALQLAAARPERVLALYLGMAPLFDEAVRLELRRVWPETIAPDWSGGHLQALFQRVRDRDFHWPAFNHSRPFRRAVDRIATPASLQRALIDQLKADGGGYGLALSVVAAPIQAMARAVTCPVLVEIDGSDPMAAGSQKILQMIRDVHGVPPETDPKRLMERLCLMADQSVTDEE